MSERLRHLQRQQALLREHLAWIDAEIARETGAASVTPPPPPVAPLPASAAPEPSDADALLERYAGEERQNPADVRRGCFIAFAAALGLLTALFAAVWFAFYR